MEPDLTQNTGGRENKLREFKAKGSRTENKTMRRNIRVQNQEQYEES